MKILVLILSNAFIYSSKSQNITINYSLLIVKPFHYNSFTKNFENYYPYNYKRILLSDSVFLEINLLEDSLYFKKDSNEWCLKENLNDSWSLFFNCDNNLKAQYNSNGLKTIIWQKDSISKNKFFYNFRVLLPVGIKNEHEETYVFHPNYGIVGIISEFIYIRQDIIDLYTSP